MKDLLKITIFVFIAFLVSCNKDSDSSSEPEVYIEFPDGWEVFHDYNEYIVVMGVSPYEDNSDIYLENVAVGQEYAKGYNLANYAQTNLEALEGFNNYELLSESTGIVNNMSFSRVEFSAEINGYNTKFLVYFFLEDDFGYAITCTALEDTYNNYLVTFEEIVATFELK